MRIVFRQNSKFSFNSVLKSMNVIDLSCARKYHSNIIDVIKLRPGGCCSVQKSFFLIYKFLELVTASGDVIKASEKNNSDLFWGMKGYGSNFG